MKKAFIIAISLILVFCCIGCGNKTAVNKTADDEKGSIRIGVAFEKSTIEGMFGQAIVASLKKLEKEAGITADTLECKDDDDQMQTVEKLLADGNKIIWGMGESFKNPMVRAAADNPGTRFAVLNAYVETPGKNIIFVKPGINETAFLAGCLAAKISKTGKIGIIAGKDTEDTLTGIFGFYAGVLTTRPDIVFDAAYAEVMDYPAKGSAMAWQMYNDGCDVIYQCAGETGKGCIEAAKKWNRYIICGGEDIQGMEVDENIIASAQEHDGKIVEDINKQLLDNSLSGGQNIKYGLSTGAVELALNEKLVPADISDYLEVMKGKIISGEIKIPSTSLEFASQYPYVGIMH